MPNFKDPSLKLDLSLQRGKFFLGSSGVEKWQSSLGARHQFIQNTDANKPQLTNDGISFNGSQYLSLADHSDFALGSADFTIEAWVRKSTASAVYHTIIGQADSSQTESTISFLFRITSANALEFYYRAGGVSYSFNTTSAPINDLSWHHVAVSRYTTDGYLYIDGVLRSSTNNFSTQILNDSSYQIAVGRSGEYTAGNYLNGVLADVRLWTRCLYPFGSAFVPPKRLALEVESQPVPSHLSFITPLLTRPGFQFRGNL